MLPYISFMPAACFIPAKLYYRFIYSLFWMWVHRRASLRVHRKSFFPEQILRKNSVQISITWMLNSQCLCSFSAAITDCVALLVTAIANGFHHPFAENLDSAVFRMWNHFKELFCFSWANLSFFLSLWHCSRKK